ncbi:UNVERIFIED_CONTAM: hypothetical protein K2H54_036817 [Gekko kuhli]
MYLCEYGPVFQLLEQAAEHKNSLLMSLQAWKNRRGIGGSSSVYLTPQKERQSAQGPVNNPKPDKGDRIPGGMGHNWKQVESSGKFKLYKLGRFGHLVPPRQEMKPQWNSPI